MAKHQLTMKCHRVVHEGGTGINPQFHYLLCHTVVQNKGKDQYVESKVLVPPAYTNISRTFVDKEVIVEFPDAATIVVDSGTFVGLVEEDK